MAGSFVIALFLVSIAQAETKKNAGINSDTLEQLDTHLQQFSAHFYTELTTGSALKKAPSMHSLLEDLQKYQDRHELVNATALIVNNLALVEKNIDTSGIIHICDLLYQGNEWKTAEKLYKRIKQEGDKSIAANVSFSLAKFHFARDHWQETAQIVETIRSDLPPEEYNHALLMLGISLQQLHKHRQAMPIYAKIPASSRYYVAAQLNMAVADIRQDWWTDAHIIIEHLLSDKSLNQDPTLTDRLYTVLGYSLLQQQYYRNSREAFRNVGLDGKYANRALLGIALTAAYQEDYLGALNAVKVLKDKGRHDLPVDESHLLAPYFYERLKQPATASAGYAEAITYFENRIKESESSKDTDPAAIQGQLIASDTQSVTLSTETVDLNEKLPKFVFENLQVLARYQPFLPRIRNTSIQREYETLVKEYQNALRLATHAVLEERIAALTHYMNQSRYGLARMQDNDTIAPANTP